MDPQKIFREQQRTVAALAEEQTAAMKAAMVASLENIEAEIAVALARAESARAQAAMYQARKLNPETLGDVAFQDYLDAEIKAAEVLAACYDREAQRLRLRLGAETKLAGVGLGMDGALMGRMLDSLDGLFGYDDEGPDKG